MIYRILLLPILIESIDDYTDYYSDYLEKTSGSANETFRSVKVKPVNWRSSPRRQIGVFRSLIRDYAELEAC